MDTCVCRDSSGSSPCIYRSLSYTLLDTPSLTLSSLWDFADRRRLWVPTCIGTLFCSWCFCSSHFTSRWVANQHKFFGALGARVRELRKKRGFSQEDMLSFGFSTRHWQQVEAGRPITVTTLLRICEVFELPMAKLVQRLDREGVYEKIEVELPVRRRASRKK